METKVNKKLKLNWKNGILYFVFIQLEIFLVSFFLSGTNNILVGFLAEPGLLKDILLILTFLILELTIRFFIYYSFFKNDRNLSFKQFILDNSISIILRFIIAIIGDFSSFISGSFISLSSVVLADMFLETEIVTTTQVPMIFLLLIFILMEILTILVGFGASKLSTYKREKLKKELYNG